MEKRNSKNRFSEITAYLAVILFLLKAITLNAQENENQSLIKKAASFNSDSTEKWSYHFQFTGIGQGHSNFKSPYSSINSLQNINEAVMSITSTLFLGRKLWKGAAIYFNPEIAGGKGLSYALGLAGAANGETFRIGSPSPAFYLARGFFQQHISLNANKSFQDADLNQLKGYIPLSRITISAGKFSIADFFDNNIYSHNPRNEFLNWSLMSNGAWDYPANTRGYTWGIVLELIKPNYAIRVSDVLVPKTANGANLDPQLNKTHGLTLEFEKKTKINNHLGSIKLLAFHNLSRAPSYNDAIQSMALGDSSLNQIIQGKSIGTTFGGLKYGLGINISQELTDAIGLFSRVGWNDGQTSTWAFTEIDKTASIGLTIKAKKIKRNDDVFGLAFVANGISNNHINYLNAGAYGFIIGDGKLPHYGYEQIIETFYKIALAKTLFVTLDYQYIKNPAYNKDRGPVNVFALRAHILF